MTDNLTYRVWVDIEVFDTELGDAVEGGDMLSFGLDGASVADFDTPEAAVRYGNALQNVESEIEAFRARFNDWHAQYLTDDGDIDPGDYVDYDEGRADFGEEALHLLFALIPKEDHD